ncbi:hypothetical protein KY312_00300 [Candidatus Woesearchaeota archaeon]|nr:hypothetical protein [Candidatus Woesearchaeota archaeon]
MEKHTIIDGTKDKFVHYSYPEENGTTIVDLSNADCCDRFLKEHEAKQDKKVRFEDWHPYFKYSKDQVLRICELYYLPQQVDEHNAVVAGNDEIDCPLLHKDKRPVTLEEIKPAAFEEISQLYDDYTNLPRGDFYYFTHLFNEEVFTWDYIKNRDHPYSIISGKRFDGFVTRCLKFEYRPFGFTCFSFDDRYAGLRWPLKSRCPYRDSNPRIETSLNSTFSRLSNGFADDKKLKKLICHNYWSMKKLYYKFTPDRWKEYIEEIKNKGEKIPEWAECETWDEYLQQKIDKDKPYSTYNVSFNKKIMEKLGFVPSTQTVSTPADIYEFIKRWVRFEEDGEHFELFGLYKIMQRGRNKRFYDEKRRERRRYKRRRRRKH